MPKYLFAQIAYDRSQERNGLGGIEIEHILEILPVEALFRLQPASGHDRVGDADAHRFFESVLQAKPIILREEGTVNDTDDVLFVFFPIPASAPVRGAFKQFKQRGPFDAIICLQHAHHRVHVARLHFPQVYGHGIFPSAGVGHIENVPDTGRFGGRVDQGDALGAAPHIPAHGVCPQPVFRAGRRVRPLGEDHELLRIGIFVDARGRGQERGPPLVAAGDLLRRILGHLRVSHCFVGHSFLLL